MLILFYLAMKYPEKSMTFLLIELAYCILSLIIGNMWNNLDSLRGVLLIGFIFVGNYGLIITVAVLTVFGCVKLLNTKIKEK